MFTTFLQHHKRTILYGVSMAALMFFLKWLELRLIIVDHAFEIYTGAIALTFTFLGIWLSIKLSKPKIEKVVIEKEVVVRADSFMLNEKALNELHISARELEVLQLMAEGLSNSEIADRLFLSLSTVKTHARNLFDKLAVARRTQAVEKARKLGLIS